MAVQISRIFHAGYQFESGGAKILFDPLFENPFSQNCFAFPDLRFDHEQIQRNIFSAVFISHYHDDHCSLESLNVLDRNIPIYLFCIFEDLFLLIKKLGFKHVFSLALDQIVTIGPFEIIPYKALDEDVDCLFHIKVDGQNILNVVDSWLGDETFQKLLFTKYWDLVLWPFQVLQELEALSPNRIKIKKSVSLPEEWMEQIKSLKVKVIIPSSCQFKFEPWSWYNHVFFPISYKKFQDEVTAAAPDCQVLRLDPSRSIILNNGTITESSSLSWIFSTPDQEADYSYNPEIKPSTTGEVAQHFPDLNFEETQKVLNYCQNEILVIFKSLEPLDEVYFNKSRVWKLSVYAENGIPISFFYQIKKTDIFSVDADQGPLAWCTEIPIQKLFSALVNGDSLTSIYVRINDLVFGTEIEKEIATVDILSDPLLRCLYSGQFGSYQRAQLSRLGF